MTMSIVGSGLLNQHIPAAVLVLTTLLTPVPCWSSPAVQPPAQPTLIEQLRQLLGLVRPVAAGGTRASAESTSRIAAAMAPFSALGNREMPSGTRICLVSPWLPPGSDQPRVAITVSGEPPIASPEPIAELSISRGETVLWKQSVDTSLRHPTLLPWPIAPMQPGESLTLQFRLAAATSRSPITLLLQRPWTSSDTAETMKVAPKASSRARLEHLVAEQQAAAATELLFQAALRKDAAMQAVADALLASSCSGP